MTPAQKVRLVLSEIDSGGEKKGESRLILLSSLQRIARTKSGATKPIDSILKDLSKSEDFSWIIGKTYWTLRQQEETLPSGTIFTPPKIVKHVISRLLTGLNVVDLGAGTGMLTLAAAKEGFRVIAIEEDTEMLTILDCLARIHKLRNRIELLAKDALTYTGEGNQQIMANPPYTRHHSISNKKKNALSQFATKVGVELPLTAGYHAYFMAFAWTSDWSEREVLLLPTNWFDAKYGQKLREMMFERGPKEIAIFENGDGRSVFENALTTACLITTQQNKIKEKNSQTIPRIRIVRAIKSSSNEHSHKGMTPLRLKEILNSNGHAESETKNRLSDVFRVKRGIATGSNDFFVLSQSSLASSNIQKRETRPILRRLSKKDLKNQVQYLWIPAKRASKASQLLVRKGRRQKIHRKYLCSQRKPWWRIGVPAPPTYFISYMGRGKPVVKANKRGLLNLNNIHGMYLREGVSRKKSEKIITWLQSAKGKTTLMQCSRRYEGGLWKLEPGDIERLPLPKHLL